MNPPDVCVICLDAVSEPCQTEPCAHVHFDFVCLASWLERSSACPLCKTVISKIRYNRSDTADGLGEKWSNVYVVPARPTKSHAATREQPPHVPSRQFEQDSSWLWLQRRQRHRRNIQPVHSSPDTALERRRQVYKYRLYSLHIGANRVNNRARDVTPEDFAKAPHLVSRARTWIRRELQVFDFLSNPSPQSSSAGEPGRGGSSNTPASSSATRSIDNSEFLLEYIIAILKSVDTQGSGGHAEDMLTDFLGRDNTRLFLHELRSWLRSPHPTLAQWDRETQYPEPVQPSSSSRSGQSDGQPARHRMCERREHQRSPYSRRQHRSAATTSHARGG